ncbi:MAG: hypothetical protein EAZ60_16205 [Oscillatoriales cyanobacterium]|uniref:hypothetical protein n=1 Tax=unclassified Microcoleus TaxID=2642155 RepID=UPI001DCF8DC2|nr:MULTISPECIES: hypothetical protein [unclassified Microcoleus]MCC3461052.1 hypothetical protein [Microcoleus sp. PH2017_11_PCY_U_A]TAE81774.1 MAG: hypothetical protein EAZ83_14210 [Oscillatoriales cyanobacterium]MCC3526744.1 hypothetical protein [Microcoleus sp. PH2017_21_RUC_O_A]TAE97708.1 MAG: hypothetical protein EAZ79_09790 [Oscillatoriales cyanobacterium]TAF19202.1 MAG: hypothetical protein EAZ73_16100 [Oscillatoriales cyanobacterium]
MSETCKKKEEGRRKKEEGRRLTQAWLSAIRILRLIRWMYLSVVGPSHKLARLELGFLDGASKIIPYTELFLRLMQLKSAVFSRIELSCNLKYVRAILAVVS